MRARYRTFVACALGAAFICAAAYAAENREEKVFPVNDNNTGLFDQPSVAMNGAVAHVAFIGDNTGTGYKVYYAAINSGVDFRYAPRDNTLILAPAATVDNTDAGNDPYVDARHPKIAVRSATEVVILFQAKPASLADTAYRLYMARLTLSGNAVVGKTVRQVQNIPAGTVEDVSWVLIAGDSTARAAYATRSAIAAAEPFQVAFARIGLDNAAASTPIAITASYPSSVGYRPIPSLKLDDLNREHIAWAADDTPGSAAGPVFYAMIKETNGVDNMVIAPTKVMTRYLAGYTFPSVLVLSRSQIAMLASDRLDGTLAYVAVNPDATGQNGLPAGDNVIVNGQFWLVPPGEAILPANFRLYRPESFYEATSGRIFLTGYGAGGQKGATFLAIKLNTAASSADFVQDPVQFAMDEAPSGIDNDYTQAAIGFPGGKVIVFWSGKVGAANRNLDMTTIGTVAAWVSSNESGCAMVPDPSRGAAGRIPGALLLFLPAAAIAARRIVKRRRRPASEGSAPGARPSSWRAIGR